MWGRLDLFGRELVAVDGTKLKAVNSRKRNFTRQKLAGWISHADERIEEYLARLDLADRAEAEAEGAAHRAAALEAKIAKMRERRELHSAMLADLVASGRIASPELLLSVVQLPHLKCSRRWQGGNDEEGEHGNAERIG
ncbi:hypothetical protein C7E20_03280 [Sphingobium sp. AEW4]|nr:hypothetical protein C7E20_03280 [Sphingobium sp. AEW4]